MQLSSTLRKGLQKGGAFELIRFAIVGGLATVVDLAVTFILVYGLDMGQHENIVTSIAFAIAFFVSYFGHRFFTFHKSGSALKFLALALSTLALRNVIVWLLTYFDIMRGIAPLILAMALVTIITYIVSKFGIFKEN